MIKDVQLVFLSQRVNRLNRFTKEIGYFKLHCKSKKLDELLTNIYNKNDKVILPIFYNDSDEMLIKMNPKSFNSEGMMKNTIYSFNLMLCEFKPEDSDKVIYYFKEI